MRLSLALSLALVACGSPSGDLAMDLSASRDLAIGDLDPGPETRLGYAKCMDAQSIDNGFHGWSAVVIAPPAWPFTVDAIQFLYYYEAFSSQDVPLPPVQVLAFAAPPGTPPSTPMNVVTASSPTATGPGCGGDPCASNGSVAVKVTLPSSVTLEQGQSVVAVVRNNGQLGRCGEPQPAGRYYYAAEDSVPYSWLPSELSSARGIWAFGHTP